MNGSIMLSVWDMMASPPTVAPYGGCLMCSCCFAGIHASFYFFFIIFFKLFRLRFFISKSDIVVGLFHF